MHPLLTRRVCVCVSEFPLSLQAARVTLPPEAAKRTKSFICFGFCFSVRWSKRCFHSADKWDSGVCVRERERNMFLWAVSYSCFWVCCCCYPWLTQKEIPCFPRRDALCHLFLSQSKTSENSNCTAALLYHALLGRNSRDSIGSVVNPGYSQSVTGDYCTASELQTSACNLNPSESHLAFICPVLPWRCCLW